MKNITPLILFITVLKGKDNRDEYYDNINDIPHFFFPFFFFLHFLRKLIFVIRDDIFIG